MLVVLIFFYKLSQCFESTYRLINTISASTVITSKALKKMNQTTQTPKEHLHISKNQCVNDRKLKSFVFPLTTERIQKNIISNVKTKDFHIAAILAEDDCPHFLYTIGLYYHYQHPELMIVGVDANLTCDIFRKVHALIKSGGSIQPWTDLPSDMTHTPMRSVPIDASNYTKFLGFGMWFYRSLGTTRPDAFPALQFV